jgi:hypothetical protein
VQPAGAREVDDQVQRLVGTNGEVEELPVPVGRLDDVTVQRGERWVVRGECVDRRYVDPLHRAADGAVTQERGQRLDLGKLRHAPIVEETGQ